MIYFLASFNFPDGGFDSWGGGGCGWRGGPDIIYCWGNIKVMWPSTFQMGTCYLTCQAHHCSTILCLWVCCYWLMVTSLFFLQQWRTDVCSVQNFYSHGALLFQEYWKIPITFSCDPIFRVHKLHFYAERWRKSSHWNHYSLPYNSWLWDNPACRRRHLTSSAGQSQAQCPIKQPFASYQSLPQPCPSIIGNCWLIAWQSIC